MTNGKIPATVITGFLGAGKTSMIRHLLASANGRRIALVINEFGDLGIDREIVTGCGIEGCREDDVVELANGCICCTVADDFLPTIEALLDRPDRPDHIVIETSGLALPKPLVKAFNWPEVKSRVTVDGVVAVVDAAAVADGRFADDPDAVQAQREADDALDHDNPLEEVFEDQIMCADMVVLNKCDLVDETALAEIRADLGGRIERAVKVVAAQHGTVDPAVLLGMAAAAEDDLAARRSHHDDVDGEHDHDDFESFVLRFGQVDDADGFKARLVDVMAAHDVLRVKGFVDLPAKPMRLVVQGVGGRLQSYFDRAWRDGEPRRTEIVVIGETGLDRAAISATLAG